MSSRVEPRVYDSKNMLAHTHTPEHRVTRTAGRAFAASSPTKGLGGGGASAGAVLRCEPRVRGVRGVRAFGASARSGRPRKGIHQGPQPRTASGASANGTCARRTGVRGTSPEAVARASASGTSASEDHARACVRGTSEVAHQGAAGHSPGSHRDENNEHLLS